MRRLPVALLACLAAFAVALVGAGAASAADPSFNARGSVEQVYVTGLAPGADVSLLDSGNHVVASDEANAEGGLLFREVTPGDGYRVRLTETGETSGPLTVLTKQSAPPSTSVYDQSIPGRRLRLPDHPGRHQARVFGPPAPGRHRTSRASTFRTFRRTCRSRRSSSTRGTGTRGPSGPQSGIATLANIMGFTVVDVNMRGTGCSGGAFDFFEPLQGLDGYDIIETIARQPWVKHGKVGMLGISYGGISQLFTAADPAPRASPRSPRSR